MSSRRTNNIEALSEQLGFLQINEEASMEEYKQTDTEMSTAPTTMAAAVSENIQAELPKNMVLDPGWFNGDQSKFEDWWRGIRLFLKSNRVNGIDNRITVILGYLRGSVVGIYAQKKLDELDKDNNTQDWDEFVKEIKTTFSDKSKAADVEWKIKTFKQGKKNTADFIIEFEALAMKADTDELHTIFLLKKNIQHDIIKTILGYPPIAMPETLKEWKVAITSMGQGYESTEERQDYKTSTGTTYGGRGQPMDIGKSNDNFWRREAEMLQLQQIRAYGKGMPSREEGTGYTNLFQMRQKGAYHQELQRKRDNEEEKGSRRIGQRKQRREEFWQRSQVGMV